RASDHREKGAVNQRVAVDEEESRRRRKRGACGRSGHRPETSERRRAGSIPQGRPTEICWSWRGLKQHRPPSLAGGCRVVLPAVESDADHICSVEALLAGADLELHFLSLGERLEPFHTDGGEVDEDVLTAVLLNEAVPLGVIEPLHLTSGHSRCLRQDESLLHGR